MLDLEDTTKRHIRTISVSTVISVIVLLTLLWAFAKPWVMNDLEPELQAQVSEALRPTHKAFEVLLEAQIQVTARDLVRLRYKRDREPTYPWGLQDDLELQAKEAVFEAQIKALAELQK